MWAAEWWKWAGSIPLDKNPIYDGTGEFCHLGQSGPVWFLAGSNDETGVVRECTIPAGKAIFYPIINVAWVDCAIGSGDEGLTDEDVRFILVTYTGAGDNACLLTSTLDTFKTTWWGEQPTAISALLRPAVRSQSPVFSINLPEEHIFSDGCLDYEIPPGESGRAIAEGHWVMLPPLTVGEHELNLLGGACNPETGELTFATEVTYHLTVVPGKGK